MNILNFYPFYVLQGNYENDELVRTFFGKFLELMVDNLARGRHTNELFKFMK